MESKIRRSYDATQSAQHLDLSSRTLSSPVGLGRLRRASLRCMRRSPPAQAPGHVGIDVTLGWLYVALGFWFRVLRISRGFREGWRLGAFWRFKVPRQCKLPGTLKPQNTEAQINTAAESAASNARMGQGFFNHGDPYLPQQLGLATCPFSS